MNKTFKTMLALMAGAMTFVACNNDDEFENINESKSPFHKMTFTAIQEGQDEGTKATIDGVYIKWESIDKISVFDGEAADDKGHFDREFVLSNGAGTTSGKFSGSAAAGATVYYALYPYMPSSSEERTPTKAEAEAAAGSKASYLEMWRYDLEVDGEEYVKQYELNGISEANQNIIIAYLKGSTMLFANGVQQDGDVFSNVVIPSEQVATAGSADPNAMLMMAKSTDASTLQFKNICAYVKVTPKFDCIAICLRSKGTENLAGTVTVDYNGGEPSTTISANGSNEVFLVGTITAGNAYYIAVRPETLSSGFCIEFLSASDKLYYARSSGNNPGLARSKVTNLGEFTTSGTWDAAADGLATSGNDGNDHGWQMVSPTLKLATQSPIGTSRETWSGDLKSGWNSSLWALPERSDVESLASAVACSYDAGTSKAKLGVGVLKYATEEVSICNGMWLKNPANTYDHLMLQFDQHAIWAKGSNYDNTWGFLYKYIGE